MSDLYPHLVVELSHGCLAVPLTVVTGPVGSKRVSLGLSAAEWVILGDDAPDWDLFPETRINLSRDHFAY
jgi:hypothetical protein